MCSFANGAGVVDRDPSPSGNVNDVIELAAPFGGWKESGFGRELGPEGLEHCYELKSTSGCAWVTEPMARLSYFTHRYPVRGGAFVTQLPGDVGFKLLY